jgi:hypothetical protein
MYGGLNESELANYCIGNMQAGVRNGRYRAQKGCGGPGPGSNFGVGAVFIHGSFPGCRCWRLYNHDYVNTLTISLRHDQSDQRHPCQASLSILFAKHVKFDSSYTFFICAMNSLKADSADTCLPVKISHVIRLYSTRYHIATTSPHAVPPRFVYPAGSVVRHLLVPRGFNTIPFAVDHQLTRQFPKAASADAVNLKMSQLGLNIHS